MLARAASAAAVQQVLLTVANGRRAVAERPLPAFLGPGRPFCRNIYKNVFTRWLTMNPFVNKVLRVSV